MRRKTISKKTRFEVFKRDGFKCQYCGASAPDVVLQVDHIEPVSKGGGDDVMNFVTACQPCNSGKSDRRLSDSSAVGLQRAQLQDLNERREQIEMMLKWRDSLKGIKDLELQAVVRAWNDRTAPYKLNEAGVSEMRRHLNRYGLDLLLKAIEQASEAYLQFDGSGEAIIGSILEAEEKLPGFLRMLSLPDAERRLFYVRGIMRNRFSYTPADLIERLRNLLASGVEVEQIERQAKTCRNWSQFREWSEEI